MIEPDPNENYDDILDKVALYFADEVNPESAGELESFAAFATELIRDSSALPGIGKSLVASGERLKGRDGACLIAARSVLAPEIAEFADPALERLGFADDDSLLPKGFGSAKPVDLQRITTSDGDQILAARLVRDDTSEERLGAVVISGDSEFSGMISEVQLTDPVPPEVCREALGQLVNTDDDERVADVTGVEPIEPAEAITPIRDAVALGRERDEPFSGGEARALIQLGLGRTGSGSWPLDLD